ncbi:DUF6612 family protein [Nosocomiicoccus ampullae]|uniref:DUF6612 family protein n=1 Tax=Nosocomiicoccus ampullae TaxID=489910 RepID=UPI001C5E5FF0|nr:DUF6612 family protein [Nosocomiicoccus ampullae]QYA48243.1 hypothetical protein KPF52_07535 [Nosocomiicoccus ampullae]
MRLTRLFILSLSSFLILTACSTEEEVKESTTEEKAEPKEVTEEDIDDEVLQKVIDQSKEVESYHTSLDIEAELDEEEDETINVEVDYINSNPPEISLSSFDVLRTVSKDGHTYFNNDEEWVEITDSVEESALFSVTYQQVVNTLMTVKDKLEHETKDGKDVYKYEGNDENVYRAIERLIHVNFGNVDVSNNDTKLKFVINNDKRIEKVEFDVEINDDEGNVELKGESNFSQFNEVKEIELPKEIE